MLWYLHLCSVAGVVVTEYIDNATGIMFEMSNGGGQFTEVTLNPMVTVTEQDMVDKTNEFCFIANSVNFPVKHNPTTKYHDKENKTTTRYISFAKMPLNDKC